MQTQIELARQMVVTAEMEQVAAGENFPAEVIRQAVADGFF